MTAAKRSDTQRLAARFDAASPLSVLVITLSDRAHAGEYADKGGPRIESRLAGYCDEHGIGHAIERVIIPDVAEDLRGLLDTARTERQLVFTTGGTGVGPRDITPEVVLEVADKVIPGVMEAIRMKYGADKPLALLSRTVAATMGGALVYTLPGSVRGVDEYLDEILKTLPHTLCVMHGLEAH